MAVIDGNPPPSNWQFRPTKLHAYEALQTLNRCFEATLLSLERLEHLGLFRQGVSQRLQDQRGIYPRSSQR